MHLAEWPNRHILAIQAFSAVFLCSVQVVGDNGLQQWVVGTLDLNLGVRLPGEELIGFFPEVPWCGTGTASLKCT